MPKRKWFDIMKGLAASADNGAHVETAIRLRRLIVVFAWAFFVKGDKWIP